MEGLEDLNPSVEILVRLLCIVPGWSEKNVQVLLQLPLVLYISIIHFRWLVIIYLCAQTE